MYKKETPNQEPLAKQMLYVDLEDYARKTISHMAYLYYHMAKIYISMVCV